ncbi:M23 family metallopeptidase [Cryobacterium sp. CG_9.6]|uniref:M23 family metallopeptidase n=1 Tax=Cryobacterium sp. CG_9.6 TaxID=2760710 RepID=UPI0024770B25|nr:M23 family metallopeptidase [Cryobacterium sp. CG_9.6]MDH6235654.1 murein DD-endopeptidase MepM/ murein hydrolase activator NlpD [Cryobacterium sp. CG_9.6]
MPDSSDSAEPVLPLTRREIRERERRSVTPEEIHLTPEAASVIVTELHEPTLEAIVIVEPDRLIAAPAATENRESDASLIVSEVPTSTMAVPLPTRSQLRAEEQGRRPRPHRLHADAETIAAPSAAYAPTGRFVPTPALPRTPPRPQPVTDRMRKFAATSMTVAAMAFVALMAVSTSLPAQALLSSADVQASAQAAQQTSNKGAQTLDLAGSDTITVERDGYSSSTIAEVAAASGIRLEASFTNNPNGTIQWPFAVGVHIGDEMGPRNCAGCSANHGGQDFNPGLGAPIQSIADGVVSLAEDGEGSLGVHMIIDHMVDGQLVSSVYAHMIHGSMNFKTGDVVKVGQAIGKTGSTGMSTGPHLHFEIREGGIRGTKVNPLTWLYAHTN